MTSETGVTVVDDALVTTAERPDARRRRPELYPFRFLQRYRFSDVDSLGHINNVAIDSLHEDARAALLNEIWPRTGADGGVQRLVVQHVTQFLAEGFYPGSVQCCAGIGRIGGSSFVVATALIDGDRCVSVADTTAVVRRHGSVGPLTDDDRAGLQRYALRAADVG